MPRPAWEETFGRAVVAEAVRTSTCGSDVLRKLGLRPAGGNHRTLGKYLVRWQLDTSHFDAYATQRGGPGPHPAKPLDEVLVEHSTYSRAKLKERLYRTGMKFPQCELCGQGEEWRGVRMGLVLDHVNGVADDNRLENLRIVCPNCNATLDTHCGRHRRMERRCEQCDGAFHPTGDQRFCSVRCYQASPRRKAGDLARRRPRPPEAQLRAELAVSNYSAVGRKHGVSDNAIRKWLRAYEREREAQARPEVPGT